MCFILEHKKPLLVLAVNVNGYFYGAGIYFFTLVKVGEKTVFFQLSYCGGRNIHKADRLCTSAKLLLVELVFLISFGNIGSVNLRIVDYRSECCVTAVIRPVCIYHSDFGKGRISLLFLEIFLTELYIAKIHSKCVLLDKLGKLVFGKTDKSVKHGYILRNIILYIKRFILLKAAFSCFYGIYEIVLYLSEILI